MRNLEVSKKEVKHKVAIYHSSSQLFTFCQFSGNQQIVTIAPERYYYYQYDASSIAGSGKSLWMKIPT
ncbi:MAG: hypothetical protein EOO20_17560 [Chryseobacterium sp.]|nr:MAG: hypothetical protein EOO20_17560 [Chryseobacterium sp.]